MLFSSCHTPWSWMNHCHHTLILVNSFHHWIYSNNRRLWIICDRVLTMGTSYTSQQKTDAIYFPAFFMFTGRHLEQISVLAGPVKHCNIQRYIHLTTMTDGQWYNIHKLLLLQTPRSECQWVQQIQQTQLSCYMYTRKKWAWCPELQVQKTTLVKLMRTINLHRCARLWLITWVLKQSSELWSDILPVPCVNTM